MKKVLIVLSEYGYYREELLRPLESIVFLLKSIPSASPANNHIDSKDLYESKSYDNFKSGGFAFCSNVCF